MNISVLTVLSELYKPFLETSLIKRAVDKKIISFDVDDFFSFVVSKERIDAVPFGPCAGMLIKPMVVERAIASKEESHGKAYKVFFSPQGKKLTTHLAREIALKTQETGHLMLVASRYEGVDSRAESIYADLMVSLGDFVLMGGDIAALAVLESTLRFIPGIVGKEESVVDESFSGPFVEYPQFTEPVVWKGLEVPHVVRSGNHAAIKQWRENEAARKTVFNHFEWFRGFPVARHECKLAAQYIPHHYTALLHNDVLISDSQVEGTTSVTSIDIHDIARSSRTYGVQQFFVVTHLIDQRKIVDKLLQFWATEGIEYNCSRHHAVSHVSVKDRLDQVIEAIELKEGKKPIVVATSAREIDHPHVITFYDQAEVWKSERPVLLIFGTGRGLSDERMHKANFLLKPVRSCEDYNHLSVRSAVAIVLDRWLGINERSR